MRRQPRWTPLLLCLALSACASGTATESATAGVRRDPNLITAEELTEMGDLTAFDALQRLRPNWLRSRGATSLSGGGGSTLPVVMVNGVTHDTPDVLRQLRAGEVREVRFISGPDATTRFGTGYVNGLIEVSTH